MKKLLFFTFLFYFLILLQESFFLHFFPYMPNIVLVGICLINLFEEKNDNSGVYLSLTGGFFLDIFSESFFGFYILTSLLISFFIKIILKNYIQFNLR